MCQLYQLENTPIIPRTGFYTRKEYFEEGRTRSSYTRT
jgi:hypothetical protein